MDSHELIDAQFDRAVEIVQSLPKNGPIQTDYEEKLTMYSLYKQATVGNVTTPRPGIWDMLGRAKWDAWAKHKDLDSYEAKWLYVDALMKVLKKYPEKTLAKDLVRELEAYAGDPSNMLLSRTLSRGSNSSSSSGSEPNPTSYATNFHATAPPKYYQNQMEALPERGESASEYEAETDDGRALPTAPLYPDQAPRQRPMSSMSGHRYRTPMAGSMIVSPPPMISVPTQQPLPRFESRSAFDESRSVSNLATSYPSHLAPSSRSDGGSVPAQIHPPQTLYRNSVGAAPVPNNRQLPSPLPLTPGSRPTIEGAVENVQAHLAALTERLETLELSTQAYRSTASLSPRGSRSPNASGEKDGRAGRPYIWDLDDMGLWSIVLQPISRVAKGVRHLVAFLAVNENRTPTLVVVRRLFLDLSFILCVLAVFKIGWKRSGMRRDEIKEALKVLGRAILGERRPRQMVNRAV